MDGYPVATGAYLLSNGKQGESDGGESSFRRLFLGLLVQGDTKIF